MHNLLIPGELLHSVVLTFMGNGLQLYHTKLLMWSLPFALEFSYLSNVPNVKD